MNVSNIKKFILMIKIENSVKILYTDTDSLKYEFNCKDISRITLKNNYY